MKSKKQKAPPREPEMPEPSAEEAVVVAAQPEPTALLTRSQAARVLGVSVSTVIRREHVLKPVVVNGVHLFDESVLKREVVTIRQRQATASLGSTAGEVAAAVFELLEAGVEPAQIVIRLRVAPDAVQALRAQYSELKLSSACKRCGKALAINCRACLEEVFSAPCPTCSRACRACGMPLGKGRLQCQPCGAWNWDSG